MYLRWQNNLEKIVFDVMCKNIGGWRNEKFFMNDF